MERQLGVGTIIADTFLPQLYSTSATFRFCSQMFSLCNKELCAFGVGRIWNWLNESTGFLKFPRALALFVYTFAPFVSVTQCVSTSERSSLRELKGGSSGELLTVMTQALQSALRGLDEYLWKQSMCQSQWEFHFRTISSLISYNNLVWELSLLFSELTIRKQTLSKVAQQTCGWAKSTIKMLCF